MSGPYQCPTDEMEALAADLVGAGDATTIGSNLAETLNPDKALTASAIKWIHKAKLHFGELKDTAADRICAKRWLAEAMKAADMRDVDAVCLIPLVVEMLFVPSVEEVFAHRLRHSRVAGVMKRMAGKSNA